MSVPIRLGLFMSSLLAVFALSYGLGHAVAKPVRPPAPTQQPVQPGHPHIGGFAPGVHLGTRR